MHTNMILYQGSSCLKKEDHALIFTQRFPIHLYMFFFNSSLANSKANPLFATAAETTSLPKRQNARQRLRDFLVQDHEPNVHPIEDVGQVRQSYPDDQKFCYLSS